MIMVALVSLSFTDINGHVDDLYPHIVSSQDGFRLLCAVCVGVTDSSDPFQVVRFVIRAIICPRVILNNLSDFCSLMVVLGFGVCVLDWVFGLGFSVDGVWGLWCGAIWAFWVGTFYINIKG